MDLVATTQHRRLVDLGGAAWQTWRLVRLAAGPQLRVTNGLQLASVAALVGQLLLGKALLEGLTGDNRATSVAEMAPVLIGLALCTAVASAASVAGAELRRVLIELVHRHLEERIIEVVVGVDLERLEDPEFHDRHQRAVSAFEDRPWDLVNGITALMGAVLGIGAIAIVVVPIAPWVLLGAIAVAVPAAWISSRTNRDLYERYRAMATLDRQRGYLASVLTAPRSAAEIRLFDAQVALLPRLADLYDRRIGTIRRLSRDRSTRLVSTQVLTALIGVGLVTALIHFSFEGDLSVAELGLAVVGVQQILQRLRTANSGLTSLHESTLFLDDLTQFLGLATPDRGSAPAGPGSPSEATSLSLEHVSFAYPGTDRGVLEDISLELRKGQVIALVGPNGAGKTTLVKLLCGLYPPSSGTILGEDPMTGQKHELGRATLHGLVTAVFQDFGRYALTVRDNITIADPPLAHDDARLHDAARQGGALELVESLPQGFDTILSREYEGGVELSVGQWQRMALARAYFRRAPFVLLDEPTAAADALNERLFFEETRRHSNERGVLLITHRLSSAKQADVIYVLDRGRIVEVGDHDALVRSDGLYAEMLRLQT